MALVTATVEQQARALAKDNREVHSDAQAILWFPATDEIRLVILTSDAEPANNDGNLVAFYFPPSPDDGLDLWSAMALIQPHERGVLALPMGWGDWRDAIEI